ncbi:hypothetical protein B0H14DRAFT_3852227 [Mycena olivaceomarginata]|nr:hypothetical protein B0H14DRAFT_3852227 [Mycena olivaceomarginata]
MSSFYILGFFQLKAGRRVAVTKPNSNFPTHYAHYSTNVWCLDNTTIPADIRVFTASTTPLVPDGMVAFAVCTAQSTATPPMANSLASNALALDALMFVVLPGNPESDTYNDHLLDEFTSMAYGVGHEDSAFNRSTANPYNYPMTQIKTNSNYDSCTVYSTCRTNFLFLFLGDNAIHSSNTFDHTGTHSGNHGRNFHTFRLISVRDCGTNWPRPEPSFEEELIVSQLALCQ